MPAPVEHPATETSDNSLESGSAEPLRTLDQRLLHTQTQLVYQQAGPTLVAAIAAVVFYVYVFYDTAPRLWLWLWMAASFLLYGLRFALARAYAHATLAVQYSRPWGHWYLVGTLLSGILWGISVTLLPPVDSIAHQAFLVVGVTGLGAGSAVSYSALRGVPPAFIIPALLPFGLYLVATGGHLQQVMGIVIILFMAVLLISALIMHKTILRTLRLALENESLVQTLRASRDIAEALNRELRAEVDERRHAEVRIRASRQELSRILDNIQDTYFRTDRDGRILRISPSVTRLLGYDKDELIGQHLDCVFTESQDVAQFMLALAENSGMLHGYELQLVRKDGTVIWVSKNAQYYRDETGEIAGVEGTARDITSLKAAEAALRAEKERALVTLESIGDGVIVTDAAGCIEYLNPVAEQLTGWEAPAALAKPLTEIFHVVDEVTRQLVEDPVRACLRGRSTYRIPGHPILLEAGNDSEHSIEANAAPILDDQRRVTGTVMVFHDVTELRGLARDMTYQASHDMLTGLVNRREFEIRTVQAIEAAQREGLQHALCYLDLDQFKVVNDTSGHIAGDELLKQLAGVLQARIRESDTLARLGGDEFGVLLEACPLSKAKEIAEDLRSVIKAERFDWQGRVFEIGVSIGLVAIGAESGGLADVMSAADAACYVAKEQGRNRTHVFDVDDTALVQHHSHMQWVQRLQKALEDNSFELYCQRVQAVADSVTGMRYNEILLRMTEAGEEMIAPGFFIPAAERYHLMPAIDRWVVHEALRRLSEKQTWQTGECFAINLSGQSLGDETFLDFVSSELDNAGVAAERICFEITETAAVANLRSAQHFIATLRKRGCVFALDDFGSGLSSFAYLKRLPVDYLKIDGRFVKDMLTDPIDHAMVESINQLGHVVGVQTIAEFVENAAILERLGRLGVDYAQGYHIHRPEPLDGFI